MTFVGVNQLIPLFIFVLNIKQWFLKRCCKGRP